MKKRASIKSWLLISLLMPLLVCQAQEKKKIRLKDSLDNKFDLSDYIIEANGFVPVPFIITEPALGGFGGGIAPIFMKKNRPYRDSTEGHLKYSPVAPTITGAVGIYTANKSWIIGAFRSGVIRKARIKYRVGAAYANVNMSFYRTLPLTGELEFKVNTKAIVGLASGIKRLGISNWYAGLQYLFMHTEVSSANDQSLPSFIKPIEMKSNIGLLSAIIELDSRDNVFTPDKGIKFHVDGGISDNIVGSDYDFWKINYYAYMYKPFWKKFVGGLRIDGQQAINSPPFYFLPFIDMRGVPAERYQGKADLLAEGELRYDVVKRWSLVFFGGTGKAFDEWSEFGDAKWVASGGLGFRYLLARKFKLRMGLDLARGPDTWAYYIVFGSNWLK